MTWVRPRRILMEMEQMRNYKIKYFREIQNPRPMCWVILTMMCAEIRIHFPF